MVTGVILPLALGLAVPVAVLYGLRELSRWYAGRRDPIDTLIRPLRSCPGMDRPDGQKMDRSGEVRWQETLRAQRKLRKPRPRLTLVKDTRRHA